MRRGLRRPHQLRNLGKAQSLQNGLKGKPHLQTELNDTMPSLPEINFSSIRAYGGSQRSGFEEFSVQLFRAKHGHPDNFYRVEGTGGDGGTEAFFPDKDGLEVGMQSKFFSALGRSQFRQIDKSVLTALSQHSKLKRYYVIVPRNRNASQITKWNTLVRAWKVVAKKNGNKRFELVWWGASELEDLLTSSEHEVRLRFWFGHPKFNQPWIDQINTTAIDDLDSRYTPNCHVRVEASRLLEALAKDTSFGRLLEKKTRAFGTPIRELVDKVYKADPAVGVAHSQLKTSWEEVIQSLAGIPSSIPLLSSVLTSCDALHDALSALASALEDAKYGNPENHQLGGRTTLRKISDAAELLSEFRSFLRRHIPSEKQFLLLTGDAGSGKSHLLAQAVRDARANHRCALLALGEYFTTPDELWSQLLLKWQWKGSVDDLLSCLQNMAEITGKPTLLCVDAINEGERVAWRAHATSFAASLLPYPQVKLVLSCRSDFVPLSLPPKLAKKEDETWGYFHHEGFGSSLFHAVSIYLKGYGIKTEHFPPLMAELENPLFLKTLCEAFAGQSLPAGPLSFQRVMKARVDGLKAKLLKERDISEENTQRAIQAMVDAFAQKAGRALSRSEAKAILDPLSPDQHDSKSLYRLLCSNGFLVEVGQGMDAEMEQVQVRFPYERFSDYFLVDRMFKGLRTSNELAEAVKPDGRLSWLMERAIFFPHPGLLRMAAILLPERFGIELPDFLKEIGAKTSGTDAFLESLSWRSSEAFTERTGQLLEATLERIAKRGVTAGEQWAFLLELCSIPSHPFNADYLHAKLLPLKMPERDSWWTIPTAVADIGYGRIFEALKLLVVWTFRVEPQLLSDEQARLVAITLLWLLASNSKRLRFRATLGAIRILRNRCDVVVRLIDDFSSCNDPYVRERLMAIAAGVAMRERDTEALERLASSVFQNVFAQAEIEPNILLRDFARTVLECALAKGCLPPSISADTFRPPYHSKWPAVKSLDALKKIQGGHGWDHIRQSAHPEAGGDGLMYGDWGRYEMQSAILQFFSARLGKPLPKINHHASFSKGSHLFDPAIAYRWILQRVHQLGWSEKRFGEFDCGEVLHGRQQVDVEQFKVERVGKKYQWIAFYELLAYLTDHFQMRDDRHEPAAVPYDGPWQIDLRGFDPSMSLDDPFGDDLEDDLEVDEECWWAQSIKPFSDEALCRNRKGWVETSDVGDISKLLLPACSASDQTRLLLLGCFHQWSEPLSFHQLASDKGRLKMWIHVRSWLVPKPLKNEFLKRVQKIHFWGHGCDWVTLNLSQGWLGTYPWGPENHSVAEDCEGDHRWLHGIEIPFVHTLCCWGPEDDRSLIPSPQLIELLGVQWSGERADFVNKRGKVVVCTAPNRRRYDADVSMVSKDELVKAIAMSDQDIVWTIVGERSCWDGKNHVTKSEGQFSAVYHLEGDDLKGGITRHMVLPIPRVAPQAREIDPRMKKLHQFIFGLKPGEAAEFAKVIKGELKALRGKFVQRKSAKRKLAQRKSPQRKSPRRKSVQRKSVQRKSPRRRSVHGKSTRKKSG